MPFLVVEWARSCHSCGNRQARNGKCRINGFLTGAKPAQFETL